MAEEQFVEVKVFCGACPDSHCGKLLYFMPNLSPEVECSDCGQKHKPDSLLNVKETTPSNLSAVGNILKSILLSGSPAKKGSELIKVRGLSNLHCKLISPLLTSYGMDKKTGKAQLLSELGQPDIFNCVVFSNKAFLIEKEHLDTPGYGRDNTGSLGYLNDTLEMIREANGEDCLVPLHSDGDGHCLVHAISRGVIGRELLWHSLRQNLKDHLQKENMKYQDLFRDFIDADEWEEIIKEADPNYHPGTNEPFGLRNMHVFGLANVLHRPIILLDSWEGMQSSGDYSAIFLPVLVPLEECKSQESLNKPLVIAWSSLARNHYVPLVGVRGSAVPKIPRSLLPKAWGQPNELVSTYIEFDDNGCCAIGGTGLKDGYVQRLVLAMNQVFFEKYEVSPELVTDVNQFVFKPSNAVGSSLSEIIEFTQDALKNESLFRCLSCQALKEVKDGWPRSWREPGGRWYTWAQESDAGLIADAVYVFAEAPGVQFMYQPKFNMLSAVNGKIEECNLCKGAVREVNAKGTIRYMNGDRTSTKCENTSGCGCGFKHFWNGKKYDNHPKIVDVSLEWNGKKIEEQVFWFDEESDPSLNSNVYEMATHVVQKHFPGEFGSETLVRSVVDKILRETELKKEEAPARSADADSQPMDTDEQQGTFTTPRKIILTGPKQKTLHKEELTMSEEEKLTKARITHRAAYTNKRKITKESPEKSSGSTKHGKPETPRKVNAKAPSTSKAPAQVKTSQANPSDIRIRLSRPDGKKATVILKPTSTYADLQETILAELGISKDRQKIRYGYPPRELKHPEDENARLPLTHGDSVSVEELPDPKVQEEERLAKEAETESMDVEAKGSEDVEESSESSDDFEGVDREKLASNLLSLLKGALSVDKWEVVHDKPELFARGGMIYEQVVENVGPLSDGRHVSIASLPGKKFSYNKKEDRFEICLGQKHIPVQPLDADMLSQAANACAGDPASLRRPDDEEESMGVFSGALRHRDASQGRTAFTGEGRTLGGNVKTNVEKKKEDVSSPMSIDGPNEANMHGPSANASTAGVIMDKPDREEREATSEVIHDEAKITASPAPTVVEMPAAESNADVAHKVHESAHKTGSIEHGGSSIEHEKSEVEPVVGSADHQMAEDEHEGKNSRNEIRLVEYEVTKPENTFSADHEMQESGHENDVQQTKLEMLNDMHASSLSTPNTAEQTGNELPNVNANL